MRIGFHSPKKGTPWGGSEELWAETALMLIQRGHQLGVSYPAWPSLPDRLAEIRRSGGRLFLVHQGLNSVFRRLARRDLSVVWIHRFKPQFVVISLDRHFADIDVAVKCLHLGVPYAVLFQVANRHRWVAPENLARTRDVLRAAVRCFFVSEENRRIMEDQVAAKIDNADIVDQSFGVSPKAHPCWPGSDGIWRLACVGRLHFASKGQDVLIEVLRRPKWRDRPIEISFWGKDNGSEGHIRDLIRLHGLEKRVRLAGVADDIEQLWSDHHALVLASRYEGSVRVLIEAMVCNRLAIATAVGRAHELIDEGETGFLAAAPLPDQFDAVMERAWSRRHEWRSMGQLAGERIRSRCSMTPVQNFADTVERLAQES